MEIILNQLGSFYSEVDEYRAVYIVTLVRLLTLFSIICPQATLTKYGLAKRTSRWIENSLNGWDPA